jgi:AcrR family transcriptional regulator
MSGPRTVQGHGPSGERADDKPAWLIGKAARLMADKGYHSTTMRDVSRATGYSLAGLYHYFSSKEDLLFQLQHRVFGSLLDEQLAVRRRQTEREPRALLRALLHNHLDFYARHRPEMKVCTFELQSLQGDSYEQVEELRRRYFKLMLEALTAVLRAQGRRVAPDRVRHQVLFVFGALNWIFMWFDPARDAPMEKLGDELCEMVLEGLAPGARASKLTARAAAAAGN